MNDYQTSYLKSPSCRIHLEYELKYDNEAIQFVNFIKSSAERHDVKLRYVRRLCGHMIFVVPKDKGANFDAFLQELILSSGLYYYAMSLETKRNTLIHQVITPIYKSLLENRFVHTHWEHIHEHAHGVLSPIEFVPTDTGNEFSKSYEVLYRKWSLKLINDEEYILELDSLMTKFLLTQIEHKKGTRSPDFYGLLREANSRGIGMADEFAEAFKKIHKHRTGGLHRLVDVSKEEISATSVRLFIYFQYFDEFIRSQEQGHEMLHGTLYARLRYGEEVWRDENGALMTWTDNDGEQMNARKVSERSPCGDCGAVKGQYHCNGCDIEECPRCHGQLLSCDCLTDEDIEYYEETNNDEE